MKSKCFPQNNANVFKRYTINNTCLMHQVFSFTLKCKGKLQCKGGTRKFSAGDQPCEGLPASHLVGSKNTPGSFMLWTLGKALAEWTQCSS